MPRTRLIAAALIVGLLAVACGGDDTDDRGDALPFAETGTAVREATGATTTTTATAVAERALEPPPRLGNRFEWCAELQAIWDDVHTAQLRLDQAIDTEAAALEAWQAATDDLDRAEAAAALDAASAAAANAFDDTEDNMWQAVRVLQIAEDYHSGSSSSAEGIAYARAWQAFADGVGDAYGDAADALEAAAAAETDARSQQERTRRDVEEREQSEFPESMLAELADTVRADTYRLAGATADLNVFTGRPRRLAVDTAVDELFDLGDSFRNYLNTVFGTPEGLARGVNDIGPVVDAARAAHSEVRGIVKEDRLAEYDALVAVFEQQHDTFVESGAAFVEAANARAAGRAALRDELDAAYAAAVAATEAHNAAADALWDAKYESLYTAAYTAFQDSFRESCA